jgi:type III restriction enzyme
MYLENEKIKFSSFDTPKVATPLIEYHADWEQVHLVTWLDRNIYDDTILPDEKGAFINKAVTLLIESHGYSLDELVYGKFRLREALENRIEDAKRHAMKKEYQTLLLRPEDFVADDRSQIVFQNGRYAFDWVYSGFTDLPKHFYPQIGNLKADGEEFECAVFLATLLEGVKFWVRNVERKTTSFSLQTCTDRFYPDFLCQLENGRILAVEYKNKRDWHLPDNVEKRQLGELWEKRSNGTCLFVMPEGKDFEAIRAKV